MGYGAGEGEGHADVADLHPLPHLREASDRARRPGLVAASESTRCPERFANCEHQRGGRLGGAAVRVGLCRGCALVWSRIRRASRVRSPPRRGPLLGVSDTPSLWAAGPLDLLASAVNIATVVDAYDVLLAVVA